MAKIMAIEPDTGWAWIILLAAFMGNLMVGGIIYSFGVFYIEFLDYFEGGRGSTAWIGSVICATYSLIGPVASLLSNKFGCRLVTITGGLLVSCGFILCTFSRSIWMMLITYGIIGGVGFGFVYINGYIMISHYFKKKRALAFGIAASGSSIGGFLFAPMSSYLINAYNWQGAMLIIGGIVLNDIAIGATYRAPPDPEPENSIDSKDIKIENKRKLLDFRVLLEPGCGMLCLSSFIYMLGFYVPFIYLPDFAREVGVSEEMGSFLLSITGITSTIGRSLSGLVSNTAWGDPLKLHNAALIIGGGMTLVLPWLYNYILLCIYSAVFGACFGSVMSLQPIILVEFLGNEKLGDSFAFVSNVCGIATLIGSPLTGVLYDSTGSYVLAFISAGSAIVLAGIVSLPIRTIHHCVKKGSREEEIVEEKCVPPKNQLNVVKQQNVIYGSNRSLTLP